MNPDRWQQISRLCHAALERDVSDRAAFLDDACAGDDDLRREVASFLARDSTAQTYLNVPAVELAGQMVALFDVEPADPWMLVGASVLFAAISLAACWMPTRRAAAVDALEALRAE